MDWLGAGALLNGALYLVGLLAASLVAGNHAATGLALASLGLAALCYGAQIAERARWTFVLHAGANVAAILGGVALVAGYLH